MLCKNLGAKSDYFPVQHQLTTLTAEVQCVYREVRNEHLYTVHVKVNILARNQ